MYTLAEYNLLVIKKIYGNYFLMKNLALIKKILETNKKINEKSLLEEFNWDSLAMLNLISALNKFKKIKSQDLIRLKRVKDLDNFISKIKKWKSFLLDHQVKLQRDY